MPVEDYSTQQDLQHEWSWIFVPDSFAKGDEALAADLHSHINFSTTLLVEMHICELYTLI